MSEYKTGMFENPCSSVDDVREFEFEPGTERFAGIVGAGYDDFWRFKGRYRVVKGSRASKKSKTAALWYIHHITNYPGTNLLVVRRTYNTLRNSCYAELKWAIDRLNLADKWTTKISPLEMSCSNGGKIFFRGLGDAMRLASITADRGKLCWVWVEEAFEIEREDDFNIIDESIRGKICTEQCCSNHELFKQLTLTFNPWSERHWLKKRFFDAPNTANLFATTTDYTMNEWLDDSDKQLFERMRVDNPKRFKVAGLGEWGIIDGLVYENFEVSDFNPRTLTSSGNLSSAFGLDFGYTNDPTAFCAMLIDPCKRIIYVFDEIYKKSLTNKGIYEQIAAKGLQKERIFADCAEPKSIDELHSLGLSGIRKARKGLDSVNHGIQFIQNHKIIIASHCTNFLKEISTYSWRQNAYGIRTNTPAGGHDHLMDAMRYGLTDILSGKRWEC